MRSRFIADPSSQARVHSLGVSLLALALATAAPAAATTFVRMEAGDLAAASTAAVIGVVTAVGSEVGPDRSIHTAIAIAPERVVSGTLPPGPVRLRERGGAVAGRAERIFGAAQYRIGERVLAFVSRGADGSLHTTAMAMGVYRLSVDSAGAELATRSFAGDVAVLDRVGDRLVHGATVEVETLPALLARLRGGAAPPVRLRRGAVSPPDVAGFTYLGEPSRWFEPDDGDPVPFAIDRNGDAALGVTDSVAAAEQALAAWSGIAGSSLLLSEATLDAPLAFEGCDGPSRIVFNDPFDEIDAPVDCRGVLGIGGYCYSDDQRVVQGESYDRIGLGKVTIGDGWGGCPIWNACNLAQVITHEVGHGIGLGHSDDGAATMAATAHFDGRCAGLGADDEAGVRFVYPAPATPITPGTPPPRPTRTPLPATPTASLTPSLRPTSTRRPSGNLTLGGRIVYYGHSMPVSGASVVLRAPNALQYGGTADDGEYAFPNLIAQSWSIEPAKSGEIAGAVTALDAAWVLQAIMGMRQFSDQQRLACDVNGGGQLSTLDAVRILELAVGRVTRLPVGERCSTDWMFRPIAAPLADQEVVMPAVDAQACRRGSVRLDPLHHDALAEDFEAFVFGDCTANWRPPSDVLDGVYTAPRGTMIELLPPRRRPGGRWFQPIGIRASQPVHALDVDLRIDASLQLVGVRRLHAAEPSLADAHLVQAGRVLVALASAAPLPSDGRPVLVLELASSKRTRPTAARLVAAAVDELAVP